MKDTEVPNPRRSSAGDCTCVLTRWEVDLLGVDLVGVDFARVKLVGGHHLESLSCLPETREPTLHRQKQNRMRMTLFDRPCATYL